MMADHRATSRRITIDVTRAEPPEIGKCTAKECGALVEWVITAKGKRMPVTHPLTPERVTERLDGTFVTTIDAGQSHFATCPAASSFRAQDKAATSSRLSKHHRSRGGLR